MKLLKYFNLIFNPIKTVSYIDGYYHQIEQIIYDKRKDVALKINLINLVLLIKCFHYFYIGFEGSLTLIERVLVKSILFLKKIEIKNSVFQQHFDAIYALCPRASFNFQGAWHLPMMIYYYENLFLKIHIKLIQAVHEVLVKKHTSFFLSTRYRNQNVVSYIRQFYYLVANVVNSLVFSNSKRFFSGFQKLTFLFARSGAPFHSWPFCLSNLPKSSLPFATVQQFSINLLLYCAPRLRRWPLVLPVRPGSSADHQLLLLVR